jgi:5-methylcytosine-specific restriction endonuclease McrA
MRYKGDKGKAWDALRQYVYERDGYVCVTCGRSKADGFQMQAGHLYPMGHTGSNNKLSWDEFNVHCQCARCNGPGLGEQELMAGYIQRKYGKKKLEELKSRRYKVDPVKDWKGLIEYYKEKLKNL